MTTEAADLHDEPEIRRAYDWRLLGRLVGYVVPYRASAGLAFGLIVLSSLLQLVGPLVTAAAIDLYVEPVAPADLTGGTRFTAAVLRRLGLELGGAAGVDLMAAVYLGSLVATFFVLWSEQAVLETMAQRIMADLRRELFQKLQRLSVSYLDRNPVGRLVTRATTDVAALNEVFTAGLVSVFGDLFLLLGIVVMLFALDWRLALVTFAILPLLFGLTVWFKNNARKSFREVRVKLARINAFLQEHVTGMSVVQLMNREKRALADFGEINDQHRIANVRAIFYYAVYYPAVALVTALGMALIVGYGGGRIVAGLLSVGALVAFLQYAQRFYQPLADLSEKYNILQAAMASSERIFELLDTPIEVAPPADGYRPAAVRGEIELDRVGFAYVPGEPVLEDVSFRIAPGETVAVVGHTGAGKSTLANLVMRFYDVSSGAVRLDGVDVREWDLAALRGAIGIVLQDVFLFSGDVASNVRLGEAAIDDGRLRRALEEVGALPFVERLPQGWSTPVRERGAGLSVGQKQLLSFARALAFDPRILILDEATASIDTETEQRIQAALGRLLAGRTSLVIAHRLSTIQRADRILVLHKGRLREEGTHQELLALRGIYHKLYQLQMREEEPVAATA